jgi:Cu(I)/Ag(I) efflux system membrane fusion protein
MWTCGIDIATQHAMPAMQSRGEGAESEPGRYSVSYGIQMQGSWEVDLMIHTARGEMAAGSYRISTAGEGISAVGGGMGGTSTTPGGEIVIDPARREMIGIKTAPVEARDLTASIRAAGRVAYDETHRAEISLKFSGWVRQINVDYVGRAVRAGEPLLTVYSPELLAAQGEYLDAVRAGASGADLATAARQRLLLWDIPASALDEVVSTGTPMEALPIVAPVGGVVMEKNVVAGSAFTAGQTLYKIASVDPVWVIASVYQYELPLVRVGMDVKIVAPFPGEPSRRGRVSSVNPYLDPSTRTGEVRVQVPNSGGDLKPGMFVDVLLAHRIGKRLAVPESAVIYSGDRRVVFVDLGDGKLAPRDVTLGMKADDYYEVVGGLAAGDVVVTSGNFLVAAESSSTSASSTSSMSNTA